MNENIPPPTSASTSEVSEDGFSAEYLGKISAKDSESDPTLVGAALAKVYGHYIAISKLDKSGIQQRISKLQDELLQKNTEKRKAESDLEAVDYRRQAAEERIAELREERARIQASDTTGGDDIPFAIATFIILLLTIFIFAFYFSAGFAALVGVSSKNQLGGIIPNVLPEVRRQPGQAGLFAFFPVLFLGLGFLVHDALDRSRYTIVAVLVLFTFATDTLIGYFLTKANYQLSFNSGLVNDPWQPGMVLTDPTFYLVLALGFAGYLIWGGLLHYVLNKNKERQPDHILSVKLERNTQLLDEQSQGLGTLREQQSTMRGQIESLMGEIAHKERDIIGYQNGVVPINVPQLKALIGEFQNGWTAYTSLMLKGRAEQTNREAQVQIDRWLQDTLTRLQTDHQG